MKHAGKGQSTSHTMNTFCLEFIEKREKTLLGATNQLPRHFCVCRGVKTFAFPVNTLHTFMASNSRFVPKSLFHKVDKSIQYSTKLYRITTWKSNPH